MSFNYIYTVSFVVKIFIEIVVSRVYNIMECILPVFFESQVNTECLIGSWGKKV